VFNIKNLYIIIDREALLLYESEERIRRRIVEYIVSEQVRDAIDSNTINNL